MSERCERWADFACAGVLVAAVTGFVALVYGLGADNDLFHSYDVREIFQYQKAYYRAALLAGRLPLWTPHTFSGWPFAANPLTQTFYPPALPSLVLTPPSAFIMDLILHLLLAAVGTFVWLRLGFALGRGSALLGGLVYALSGVLVGHAFSGHVPFYEACAYVPWVLLAIDRTVARLEQEDAVPRAGAWPWIGGILLGLQTLSGGVPFVWLTMLLAVLYRAGVTLVRTPTSLRTWGRELAVLAAVASVGAGAAAVQLAPTFELARLSSRAAPGWDYAAEGSYPPALLPTLVLAGLNVEQKGFWEYYAYVGLLPLALAAWSLVRARREPRMLVLWAIGALAFLFVLGRYGFLFPLLWQYVPGFGAFRAPARALVVPTLIVAVSAAIGFDALLARRRPGSSALLVALACTITFADVTVAARANRHRLFLRDPGILETPAHAALVQPLEEDRSWYRYWFLRALFRENEAYALGARSIGGYDNLMLERYRRFIHYMTDTPVNDSLVTILHPLTFKNTPSPFPFKILGDKYSTHDRRLWIRDATDPVFRGWFVTRATRVPDEEGALRHIRRDAFRPYDEVVFETPEADALGVTATDARPAPATARPEVVVTELTPEHLHIRVGPHPAGFLVLSEIFYPGWRAAVDGRDVPIHRADSILRSIALQADESEIEMIFAPRTVRWGAAVSIATLALAACGVWTSLRR